jgi:hypothetical protein
MKTKILSHQPQQSVQWLFQNAIPKKCCAWAVESRIYHTPSIRQTIQINGNNCIQSVYIILYACIAGVYRRENLSFLTSMKRTKYSSASTRKLVNTSLDEMRARRRDHGIEVEHENTAVVGDAAAGKQHKPAALFCCFVGNIRYNLEQGLLFNHKTE